MLAASVSFTLAAAIMRHLASVIPEPVIVFFRFALAVVPFLPWAMVRPGERIMTRRPLAHSGRAALGVGSFLAFSFALARLPFGDAVTLALTTPLWTIAIARLFGDQQPRARMVAVLVGFVGVLMIARPHATLSLAVLAGLAGAALLSLSMRSVRDLGRTEPPARTAFLFLAIGSLIAVPMAVAEWVTPPIDAWPWLAALGLLSASVQFCLSKALAAVKPDRLAIIDYARLPTSILIGLLVWEEIPSTASLAGSALIVLACVASSRSQK